MESMSRTWRLLWCKVCLWPGDFQVNLINSVFKVMILTIGATEWAQKKFRVLENTVGPPGRSVQLQVY